MAVAWNDTIAGSNVELEMGFEERRRLPTSSSALDVSMTITGEYRPPPFRDIDLIVEDSINRASSQMVRDLRQRGSRSGTTFFERVDDLRAVRVSAATPRPTRGLTYRPTTYTPTENPTFKPTPEPTESPTESPSRAPEQMLQSGSGQDLYVGTAKSFGNLFEIRTKSSSETVLINGMDFYSSANAGERVSYEVWTKEGTWQGFEGTIDQYEKIAEGTALSRGACDESSATQGGGGNNFVQIPFEEFTSVAIRGGGESRSFYITLTTKDIMYKRGKVGSSSFRVQVENPDIELYEGAGVLVYPFSEATESYHYSKPRGFLGRIWYERNPCKYGGDEWPCVTRSPVTNLQLSSAKPTQRPTPAPVEKIRRPTGRPTREPTKKEEGPHQPPPGPASPTPAAPISAIQNSGRPTSEPAKKEEGQQQPPRPASPSLAAPISAMQNSSAVEVPNVRPIPNPGINFEYDKAIQSNQTNIVVRLHNVRDELVMSDQEQDTYSEVLMEYLRSHPSIVGASINVLNVAVWHQEMVAAQVVKKKKKEKVSREKSRGNMSSRRALREEVGDSDLSHEGDANNELFMTESAPPSEDREAGEYDFLAGRTIEVDATSANAAGSAEDSKEVQSSLTVVDTDPSVEYVNGSFPSSSSDGRASSIDVTTIIHTVNSILPTDVTDFLLLNVLEESNAALIEGFHDKIFYTFFKNIDEISGRIILTVTYSPSPAPTTLAQFLASVAVGAHSADGGGEEEDKGSINIFTLIGVMIGGLWGFLTLFGLFHVVDARRRMKYEHSLRQKLTKNQEDDDKLKESQLHTTVFDRFAGNNLQTMDYKGESRQLMEDMISSGRTDFLSDEEDQGSRNVGGGKGTSVSSSGEATFANIFEVSGVKRSTKISASGGDSFINAASMTTSNARIEERLQKQLSSNSGMTASTHSKGSDDSLNVDEPSSNHHKQVVVPGPFPQKLPPDNNPRPKRGNGHTAKLEDKEAYVFPTNDASSTSMPVEHQHRTIQDSKKGKSGRPPNDDKSERNRRASVCNSMPTEEHPSSSQRKRRATVPRSKERYTRTSSINKGPQRMDSMAEMLMPPSSGGHKSSRNLGSGKASSKENDMGANKHVNMLFA